MPYPAFVIASLLDGKREAEDIQAAIAEQFEGAQFAIEDIQEVVKQLDSRCFLQNDNYLNLAVKQEAAYKALPVRPHLHLESYGKTSEEVTTNLDAYFEANDGAGRPESPGASDTLAAIVAPHIDFHRGGPCYSHAYRTLAEHSRADLYVVLGVSHQAPPSAPDLLAEKDYDTPLGVCKTDKGALKELRSRTPDDWTRFEMLHRNEHSIEFQALFMKHVLKDREFTILPILCGRFEETPEGAPPSILPANEAAVTALVETVKEASKSRSVCVVAGVDFAHVGPRFNDPDPVTPQKIKWMEEKDRESLDALEAADADAFWASVMKDGNARNVCGHVALYTMLRLIDSKEGKLLRYGHAPDPAGGIVSFASMEFRHP